MEENYQQYRDENGEISNEGIIRLPDRAWIPNNDLNKDWVRYQEWLTEGKFVDGIWVPNTPLPPNDINS